MRSPGVQHLTAIVAISAAVAVAFFNAVSNPFHIDDRFIILGAPRVQAGDYHAIYTQQ